MTLGGATSEAIKGLSSSPMILLIAVINVIMIGALVYVAKAQADERGILIKYLNDCQRESHP